MKRREFLKAAALSAAALALPRGLQAAEAIGAAAKGRKPNIIFILADDRRPRQRGLLRGRQVQDAADRRAGEERHPVRAVLLHAALRAVALRRS